MANVNSAAVNNNGTKKAPEAPQLTLSPKPGTPIPVGHSGTLVRIDN